MSAVPDTREVLVPFAFRLAPDERDELVKAAAAAGTTPSKLGRSIVREWIAAREQATRKGK